MSEAFQRSVSELQRSSISLTGEDGYSGEDDVEILLNIFQLLSNVHTPATALVWILTTDELVPEWGIDIEGESIRDIFRTVAPNSSGHVTQIDSEIDSDSELTDMYLTTLSMKSFLTVNTLAKLIHRRHISERQIYTIINTLTWLAPDDIWYLTKVVIATFDERFAEAIHLGVARLENVLYRAMDFHKNDVDSLMGSGSGTRTLRPLLNVSRDHLGDDFYYYLKYMYTEPEGQLARGNIRNRVAHGQFTYHEDSSYYALLILFDILRVGVRCHPTPFRAIFGYPSKYTAALAPTTLNNAHRRRL